MAGYVEDAEKKRARMKRWREENKERIKAYKREWVAKNAEAVAEYQKEYMSEYQSREEVQFNNWVRNLGRNYRMTPMQFNELWAKQDGKCAVCDCALKPRGRNSDSAAVDHNHDTGEVRGILCQACNRAIGLLKDSPKVLKAAAEYLEKQGSYENLNLTQ